MEECSKASERVACTGGGSITHLVTTSNILHNFIPFEVVVTGSEIKEKVIAFGDPVVLFAIGSRSFKVTIARWCSMPTNYRHTLVLAPFRREGCNKATHSMHNKLQITLESEEVIGILISIVLNHLDHAKFNIFPGRMSSPCRVSQH